jgi:hypothetical protein
MRRFPLKEERPRRNRWESRKQREPEFLNRPWLFSGDQVKGSAALHGRVVVYLRAEKAGNARGEK